jgi:hypothetical protein
MNTDDIALQRLRNQQIAQPNFQHPSDVVARLSAVQAQDYLAGLWAVGLRTPGAAEHTIEQALAERAGVRTWPTRGTIHFVAAPTFAGCFSCSRPEWCSAARVATLTLG